MKKELKVGLFAVLVLVVGWGVVRYLKGSSIFSKTNTYYAYYEQVSGLQPASYVVLYGVKVGSVTNITLDEDPSKGVEVEFTVDKRYKIPVDSKAKIFSDGIMGGKAIDIEKVNVGFMAVEVPANMVSKITFAYFDCFCYNTDSTFQTWRREK